MRRREFIVVVGGVAAWPLAAHAQQSAMPVIGLLGSATAGGWAPYVSAFHQGLRDGSYVEGRNVAIEARWADSQYTQKLFGRNDRRDLGNKAGPALEGYVAPQPSNGDNETILDAD